MTINEGTWDRMIRIVIGLALGLVSWRTWPAALSFVSLAVGMIAVVTGVVGYCPLYQLFGVATKRQLHA